MDGQKDSFSWGELKVEQVDSLAPGTARAVANGGVVSILFDKAQFNLSGDESPNALTWAGALSIPVKMTGDRPVHFQEIVRGALKKDEDARVLLLFDMGGETHLHDYDYGCNIDGEQTWESIYATPKHQGDIYRITLFVAIERRTPESVVLVAIDTIDIEASSKEPSKQTAAKKR